MRNTATRPQAALGVLTKPRAWVPALTFLVAMVAIGTSGFLLYDGRAHELERTAQEELTGIASLKVEQIVRWMDNQRKDAEALSRDNLLVDEVERWFEQGAPEGVIAQRILTRLGSIKQLDEYERVMLLDGKAQPRLHVGKGQEFDSNDTNLALQAMRENVVTRSDIHLSDHHEPEMDMVAPLAVPGATGPHVIGAIYFHLDLNRFFFPYIQSWHTRSPSAQTILARRDGNEVRFLTEHRERKGAPLMRLPVDQPLLPAAIALRGRLGVIEGVDYRGVPVIADTRKVPGTPWILVTKMDRAEINTPLRGLAVTAGGLVALFMLLVAFVAALWWRNQHSQQLALLLEGKLQRQALEQHFDYATKYARDNIMLFDETGRLIECNDASLANYGYTRDELLQLTASDIRAEQAAAGIFANMELAARPGGVSLEGVHRRKDGSTFPVEVSALRIEIDGRRFYQSIIRDITDRKRTETALRESEEQFRSLVEQSIAGIYILQDGKLAYVNPRFAEIIGQGSTDELIGTDPLRWVAEADRGEVAANMRRLLDGEAKSIAFDFGVLRRDGVAIRVGVNAARATHEGRPAIIGLLQDISEKKRAEEEILRYVEQLKTAVMSTVEVATTISELRDPYTAGHERRVAGIAVAIGTELGFDANRRAGLRIAGQLHDIGKITVPAEILSKPGKLSAAEFQLVKGHPQAGYDVLKGVSWSWPVAEVALQHHERMDGSDYPQGLKGEAIVLEARIMAVADVVEAMSSHRPYRAGLGIEKALAEIERGRGTAYDTDVADTCLRLFREKGYRLPTQ